MQLGFIGLGKMGSRMVLKLVEDGHNVLAWNRSQEAVSSIKHKVLSIKAKQNTNFGSFAAFKNLEELVKKLKKPRVIWLMLPAGEATQTLLEEITPHLEKGDCVVDGGNAYWKDTERRYLEFRKKNIRYLGIGVSGGILAAKNGYPMMVGGDVSAYRYITTILDTLAKPHGGHEYFGTGGAGHFIKMVHNGIEYGFMQALGEGFGVLATGPYKVDLLKTANLWQKGTIIQSFLLDRAKDALQKNARLDDIKGVIDESGEARWTVEAGQEQKVPVENISQALEFRRKSQTDKLIQKSFAARMVASLRREFGGHGVHKKET